MSDNLAIGKLSPYTVTLKSDEDTQKPKTVLHCARTGSTPFFKGEGTFYLGANAQANPYVNIELDPSLKNTSRDGGKGVTFNIDFGREQSPQGTKFLYNFPKTILPLVDGQYNCPRYVKQTQPNNAINGSALYAAYIGKNQHPSFMTHFENKAWEEPLSAGKNVSKGEVSAPENQVVFEVFGSPKQAEVGFQLNNAEASVQTNEEAPFFLGHGELTLDKITDDTPQDVKIVIHKNFGSDKHRGFIPLVIHLQDGSKLPEFVDTNGKKYTYKTTEHAESVDDKGNFTELTFSDGDGDKIPDFQFVTRKPGNINNVDKN